MNKFEKIANDFVESQGEIYPGIKYGYANREEFFFKVFYDFILVRIDNLSPAEPPFVGGMGSAKGFVIDNRTHEVEVISFSDYWSIKRYEQELEDVYYKLEKLKENLGSLDWLKTKYNLSSVELLKVKKMIDRVDFSKENIINELNELMNGTRYL